MAVTSLLTRTKWFMPKYLNNTCGIHHVFLRCGNREQVGYGWNGNPEYRDTPDFPFPSLRWKEPTPELFCLWEKEKGDWTHLTKAEKKELYRASFRQTFAEMNAPTGEWKQVLGIGLMVISIGIWWAYAAMSIHPGPASTFCDENRRAQLRRMLDLNVNPIQGISSHWDYEKNTWKYGRKP